MSQEKSSPPASQQDVPLPRPKKNSYHLVWWLVFCIILTIAWFTGLHSPHSPLSIEERVDKILSQTPLFGMEAYEIF